MKNGYSPSYPVTGYSSRRIFVSRHPGAIAWAKRYHWGMLAEFVTHLEISEISPGDVVIGTLPIQLASQVCARGAHYLHLTLAMEATQRGTELSADELEAAGAHLVAYHAHPVTVSLKSLA